MTCIILFSHLSCSCVTKEENKGLFWKISGNGLKEPSYLFGTAHGDNYSSAIPFLDSIPHLCEKMSNVRQFIGEKNHFKGQHINANNLLMDSVYSDFISKEDIAFLDSVLIKYLGKTSDKINLKPIILTQIIRNKKSLEVNEALFFERIKAKGYIDDSDWTKMNYSSEENMDFYLQKKDIQ